MTNNLLTKHSRPNSNQELRKQFGFEAIVMPPKRILDLFCGAGGASKGLHYAFPFAEITGVDKNKMKNYPFKFIKADAMEISLDGYDFIWASPPCQKYSRTKSLHKNEYPDLVEPIRERLKKQGVPYIIENVPGAPLINPIRLCGTMFGLKVIRHRLFECNPKIGIELGCNHYGTPGTHRFPYKPKNGFLQITGNNFRMPQGGEAMGINWMNKEELAESIPPAYSYWLAINMAKKIYTEAA